MAKAKTPNRLRKSRNMTLNPAGVEKILEVGAAMPVPETNLSRLVDRAIAEFVAKHVRKEGKNS
jgi:hypothetical protein